MTIVPQGSIGISEISDRIHQLQAQYIKNPLVKNIDYRIGLDWSNDPAVFIDVTVVHQEIPPTELNQLAQRMRADLLQVVRSDELGLHSYLNFTN